MRKALRARRGALGAEVRARASEAVCQRLEADPVFAGARRVAGYRAVRGELDVDAALRAKLAQGGRVFLPRIGPDDRLEFVDAGQLDGLIPGAFGIEEPVGLASDPSEIDVFLVPALAFDRRGHRLGSGRGYYDRALADLLNTTLIGVGYDWQLLDDELPTEAHDHPVDIIATDARWHVSGPRSSLHTSKE
ncbi:5-formyltetrahydrofolate cyclo-ligase [Lujinxingia litoralis]|uniref:5-formyltetrahydrofolate cyclo-ligase n=1 Tax=Lujinxingia litoralis TaxID=2211119 RepID=UPI00131449E6|nr:5-formyltetrahydrofolate cyclo-ligase [Lujinxingia litoralis]